MKLLPTRLNPFARLTNAREVWAWGMYDLANQSFQLIINTLLFGVYMSQVVAANPEDGTRFWSRMVAGAMLIVVVLSPFVGAMADARAWKKQLLAITGVLGGLGTALLALVSPGDLWLAVLIYIPAAVVIGLGENVLAAFLPELADRDNMGFVSALGWTMSYVGAIVLQLIVLLATLVFGLKDSASWPPLFVFSGVWFLLGIVPSILMLKERAAPVAPRVSIVRAGFERIISTWSHAFHYRQLLLFLAVFFVYSLGTQTVIYFSSIIAKDLGFTASELFTMVLVLSLTAGAAAMALVKYQDRLGALFTVRAFLIIFAVTTAGMAVAAAVGAGKPVFWALSLGIGLGIGGLGTASRAVVGLFTPVEKSAEFFGLWGMTYKLAGVVGPITFAEVSIALGRGVALGVLAGFFAVGFILLAFVRESEGISRAQATPQVR